MVKITKSSNGALYEVIDVDEVPNQICGLLGKRAQEPFDFLFYPMDSLGFSSDELTTISDKLKELNGTSQQTNK